MNTLIANYLPTGDVAYTKEADGDGWGVAIFEPGSTTRLMTVARGMDKNVALWLAVKLSEARKID